MEFIPADVEDGQALADLERDVRVVSVIWSADSEQPVIDYSGCSAYEAEGLMRAAVRALGKLNSRAMEFLEPECEDEEEDEDGDVEG